MQSEDPGNRAIMRAVFNNTSLFLLTVKGLSSTVSETEKTVDYLAGQKFSNWPLEGGSRLVISCRIKIPRVVSFKPLLLCSSDFYLASRILLRQ